MTTVMLILGMMPIALGRGPGSGSRGSIARVIIGGQALSLLITLLITPVAYSLFDDLRQWLPRGLQVLWGWGRGRLAAEPPPAGREARPEAR
jgi:HAE1 family hydrophobic/amphiphilic exporter-1